MTLPPKTVQALEFNKILDRIAERTVSVAGRNEIESLAPTDNPDRIEARLRPVLETMDLIGYDDPVPIGRIPDIRVAADTASVPGTTITVGELVEIEEVLRMSRRFMAYFSKRKAKYPRLQELVSGLSRHPDLEAGIQRSIDPSTETVKDSASVELKRIRRSLEQTRSGIRSSVESILSRLPDTVVQERLITIRNGRFVIPVRENLKHRLEGLVHDQSASGATLFVEPMATLALNNRLRQLELAEQQEIKRVLHELTRSVGQVSDRLIENQRILGRFDAIYATAGFSRELNCSEPVFNVEGCLELHGARHPLLFCRLNGEGKTDSIVPLSLSMGSEGIRTLVLTGPNAGGKTVALKTVGLLALMAQTGLPVPAAEHSQVPIFTGVFADIGDAQSIENDLSTFSSHVANLVEVTNHAEASSLILLDEIGASTDPDQGAALAMALLNTLNERGCRTVATTHHGALKAFAHRTEGMANGSMAFDADTLAPTFQLRLNTPGSSYAFEIARRLQMPSEIVDEARRIAGSDIGRLEALIADLDDTYHHTNEELDRARSFRREMERLKAEYSGRLKEVEQRERELKRGAEEEARRILDGANALIERTVSELRQRNADRDSIKKARANVERARRELATAVEETHAATPILEPGCRVLVRSLGKEGVVADGRNEGSRVPVEIGKLRMQARREDLKIVESAEETTSDTARFGLVRRDAVSSEVDLRGLTVDEAVDTVDRYIDELYLAGMERAAVIHGKGTGALRRAISAHLRGHEFIKSQRLGLHNEGGAGVTVITLDQDP
ncbi:MAG: endonuclease MutS2 [Candidatus Latescibacteria bacterium]|nr:endonuclease MutS2 [Candidatus Latescibacterota bacterium]